LRLVGARTGQAPKFQFSFQAIFLLLRDFKHWKIVGICLIPFVLVAGALVAASAFDRHSEPPAPSQTPALVDVDPHALNKLTDLTRADQLVRDRLAALKRAAAVCQKAEQNLGAIHSQSRGAVGPGVSQAADQAVNRARQAAGNARKEFEAAFAQYQKLGGAIDYRQQLP
jgi:hypothetical protein